MDRLKVFAMLTMFSMLLVATAISGCTTGSMVVSPTPGPTVAPTAQPSIAPTAAPAASPAATPQATPTATPAATPAPTTGPYPTMGPWVPGNDTHMPSLAPGPGYLISVPWIDQKIRIPSQIVLKITGNVANPLFVRASDLGGYPQRTSTWVNVNNSSKSFTGTGPELNALLNAASPNSSARSVKLIASDGSTCTLSLSAIRADSNAIVAVLDDGSLRSCIPSQSAGKAQLRGLIEIQVS